MTPRQLAKRIERTGERIVLDTPRRIDMPKLVISYDAGVDVLYISIGEPRPGIAAEYNDGDFIRIDPDTSEVVGITLLDFRERFIEAVPTDSDKVAPEECEHKGRSWFHEGQPCPKCG